MFKRPNFFLLVGVRPQGWRRRVFVPLPLFVVDHLVELLCLLMRLGGSGMKRFGGKLGLDLRAGEAALDSAWWGLRHSGSFVLMDVESDDMSISLRLF